MNELSEFAAVYSSAARRNCSDYDFELNALLGLVNRMPPSAQGLLAHLIDRVIRIAAERGEAAAVATIAQVEQSLAEMTDAAT